MTATAWIAFDTNADQIRRLLEMRDEAGSSEAGREMQALVLNESAIVLITAIWESFCETAATDAVAHVVDWLAKSVPPDSSGHASMTTELVQLVQLVGGRWARLVEESRRRLHTPYSANIKKLFDVALGLADLPADWSWPGMASDNAQRELDKYVTRRHEIAHGAWSTSKTSQISLDAKEYFELVRRLVDCTSKAIDDRLRDVTGTTVSPGKVVAKGYCECGRERCVDSNVRMYCYWREGLSDWVVAKHLYWKCYDELIQCSRCHQRHKRGHVGLEGKCSSS